VLKSFDETTFVPMTVKHIAIFNHSFETIFDLVLNDVIAAVSSVIERQPGHHQRSVDSRDL
jgi:hypothetical protein